MVLKVYNYNIFKIKKGVFNIRKYGVLGIIMLLIIFIIFYSYNCKRYTIVNSTENKIDTIQIIEDSTIKNLSIDKFSTKTFKVSKDSNKVNLIYFYNNNESSESFEIINKELKIKHSKILINSIDLIGKMNIELK